MQSEWETITDYTPGHHTRMQDRRTRNVGHWRVALVFVVCIVTVVAAAWFGWNYSTSFLLGLMFGYLLRAV